MKILFLVPYPLQEAPSQRFRFEQYADLLKSRGHIIETQSFLSSSNWQVFFNSGKPLQKLFILLSGFLKRVFAVTTCYRYQYVFIHREALPIGPPVIEWMLSKVFRKKLLYDFDDAIWLTDRANESLLLRKLKSRSKVAQICTWSEKVSCGNAYLANYARQFNHQVLLNPTTIDCEHVHNPALYPIREITDRLVIGWTGSHSTLKYLSAIEPVLQQIEKKFAQVDFLVIADRAPSMKLSRLLFVHWNSTTEIEDLLKIDIGIMPLPDDEWAKGKCGFKALQYMALEIPAIISPVGVNTEIVTHGIDGFLCTTESEWFEALEKLITNSPLRKKLGVAGRKKIINSYSVTSNSSTFLSLFES